MKNLVLFTTVLLLKSVTFKKIYRHKKDIKCTCEESVDSLCSFYFTHDIRINKKKKKKIIYHTIHYSLLGKSCCFDDHCDTTDSMVELAFLN